MKKFIFLVAVLCFTGSFAFAQEAKPSKDETVTLKGTIVDNMCAGTQTPAELAEFVKTHPKECVLKPACSASGYSILAEGKLQKFDKASNAKITDFLSKQGSKLEVVITTKKTGDELSIVSVENQM